jgi:hypothetical protein
LRANLSLKSKLWSDKCVFCSSSSFKFQIVVLIFFNFFFYLNLNVCVAQLLRVKQARRRLAVESDSVDEEFDSTVGTSVKDITEKIFGDQAASLKDLGVSVKVCNFTQKHCLSILFFPLFVKLSSLGSHFPGV